MKIIKLAAAALILAMAPGCSKKEQSPYLKLITENVDPQFESMFETFGASADSTHLEVAVEVDPEGRIMKEMLKPLEEQKEELLAQAKRTLGSGEYLDKIMDKMDFDFSLSSDICPVTQLYRTYVMTAVGTAEMPADSAEIATIHITVCDANSGSVINEMDVTSTELAGIKKLKNAGLSLREIDRLMEKMNSYDAGVRLSKTILPAEVDEWTTLTDVNMDNETHEYIYMVDSDILPMIKEVGMDVIAQSAQEALIKIADAQGMRNLTGGYLLGRKIVYTYCNDATGEPFARITFPMPSLDTYKVENL